MNDKNKKLIKVTIITFVVLGLMLAGGSTYMYNNGLSGKYANTQAKEGQIKVACVGDSITYGHGISDWEKNNYPAVLQELLGDKYHVANFGSSGACVNPDGDQPYVSRAVYKEALEYDADIIVFMMGTNDSKPENWTNAKAFMEDYAELLSAFTKGKSDVKVYLGLCAESYFAEGTDKETGLAKYDIQPAIVDEIVETINMYQALQSSYPPSVIDIHSLTEAHPEWFETDGVHPNNDGAKAIAQAVADAILPQE